VIGTPPMGFQWVNTTTSTTITSAVSNNLTSVNTGLTVNNVPANWNGDQLELTVTNAYGTTNAFVTLSIANVNSNPTNILFSTSGGQLTLSWPADHTGWRLQAQTNSLSIGINTNWADVNGSSSTNKVVVPINMTNGSVFYRLIYP
jgi:hypothetical protein